MNSPALDRLATWFREWHDPLRRFLSVRRAVMPADIDDIAQEVFLRMLRYGRSGLVRNPQAYLFKIAANVAAEWSMQPNRRHPHDSNWLDEVTSTSSAETGTGLEIADDQLDRAVKNLSPRAREIVRLHYTDGLTHEAIAERMNVTRRVVKRDLIGAYASLRRSLQQEEESI